jgi:hypothetical protein
LKDWKKRSKLILSTMAFYSWKSKKSLTEPFFLINKMGTYSKEKVLVRRSPDIK